jgi:hypothetical protein
LLPPNQVVYKSAFASLNADLRYTTTKAFFESDVILLEQPPAPGLYGLDPKTTRLEVWHEWLDAPPPRVTPRMLVREPDLALRTGMADPDFTDEILNFGGLWFPTGAGYALDGSAARNTNTPAQIRVPNLGREPGLVPVGKKWLATPQRNFLIESTRLLDIQPMLNTLPPNLQRASLTAPQDRMLCLGEVTAPPLARQQDVPIQVAGADYQPAGWVLDYVIEVTGYEDYTFEGQTTYLLGGTYFQGTVTIESGAILKYARNGYGRLLCTGSFDIICSGVFAILTSEDDDGVGEQVSGSTGCPSWGADVAIWDYFQSGPVEINGVLIRWARTAVQLDASGDPCSGLTHTLWDAGIEFCNTGIYLNNGVVDVSGSYYAWQCAVQTPTTISSWPEGCSYFTGGFLDGSCSLITSPPAYQVVPSGSNATFSVAGAQPCLTYQWYRMSWYGDYPGTPVQGATGTSLALTGVQLTDSGRYYRVVASSGIGTASAVAKLVVLDTNAWVIWTNFLATSSGKSIDLWTTPQPSFSFSPGQPPTFIWNTNCLLYGMTGFTALSPFREGGGTDSGVTALTRRHAYMRGHGVGPNHFSTDTNYAGTKVWFFTADNEPVPMTIAAIFNRDPYQHSDAEDYTILIFTQDLTNSITPLAVRATPSSVGVLFCTSQFGYMSANMNYPAPFVCTQDYCDASRPPFNDLSTFITGDSGRPDMIPTLDGSLVFIGGRTTSGPSVQMQKDMDELCTNQTLNLNLNINDYQLNWHNY